MRNVSPKRVLILLAAVAVAAVPAISAIAKPVSSYQIDVNGVGNLAVDANGNGSVNLSTFTFYPSTTCPNGQAITPGEQISITGSGPTSGSFGKNASSATVTMDANVNAFVYDCDGFRSQAGVGTVTVTASGSGSVDRASRGGGNRIVSSAASVTVSFESGSFSGSGTITETITNG